MTDVFSREKRSEIMSKILGKDSKPEIFVRRMLHGMGYRFRLHAAHLPGKPDIVLPRHRKVLFIHGCFWHSHPGCKRATIPRTNTEFWAEKLARNRARDERQIKDLEALGWKVLVIWTCEFKNTENLQSKISKFMHEGA